MNESKKPMEVPFDQAKLDQVRNVVLLNGRSINLASDRSVEVHEIEGEAGLCIRIFSRTQDGKTSKLVFGLRPDAAVALHQLLASKVKEKQKQARLARKASKGKE